MKLRAFAGRASLWAALSLPLVAWAQEPKQDTATTKISSPAGTLSDAELQILAHVHHSDQMEVKAGKLAMQKGTTQAIKSFGKMLVDDHGANDRQVLAFVQKQRKALPNLQPINEADQADLKMAQQTMDTLNRLEGADFDREFLRAQVAMHDKTLAELDLDIAKIEDNPDLVSMLRSMKPVLHKHAEKARALLAASTAYTNK
jgi:putative membrane protein